MPIKIRLSNGAEGYLCESADVTQPALLFFQEIYGVNEEVVAAGERLAALGYSTLVVDLFDGWQTTDLAAARLKMAALDHEACVATIRASADFLRQRRQFSGKLGALGYCMGGAWALNAAIAEALDCAAVYYGNVERSVESLAHIRCPVIGHFGSRDHAIPNEQVETFALRMAKARRSLELHWYDQPHRFANEGTAQFAEVDGRRAANRTRRFLAENLGPA